MKKLLIAVDDTKSTKAIFEKCTKICKCIGPETIILLYVEQLTGRSLLDDMVTDAELSTLKEYLAGSEYKEAIDSRAVKVVKHYRDALQATPPTPDVKTLVKTGHPAEMILETAKEEGADMILIGSRGKRVTPILMGSVSREVANLSEIPVLIVK